MGDIERCEEGFDFFLHVITICTRPKGHAGKHWPTMLAGDERTAS